MVIIFVEGGIDLKPGYVWGYWLNDVADHHRALVRAFEKVLGRQRIRPHFVQHRPLTAPTAKSARCLGRFGAVQFLTPTILPGSADHSILRNLPNNFDDLIVRTVQIDRKSLTPMLMSTSTTGHHQEQGA